MYLRATVTYSDKFGPGKTASAVSANLVEAKTLSQCRSFLRRPGTVMRDTPYIDVAPVRRGEHGCGHAHRPALYRRRTKTRTSCSTSCWDTPDLEDDDGDARFTIDSASGQIMVSRVLGADTGEREDEGHDGP